MQASIGQLAEQSVREHPSEVRFILDVIQQTGRWPTVDDSLRGCRGVTTMLLAHYTQEGGTTTRRHEETTHALTQYFKNHSRSACGRRSPDATDSSYRAARLVFCL